MLQPTDRIFMHACMARIQRRVFLALSIEAWKGMLPSSTRAELSKRQVKDLGVSGEGLRRSQAFEMTMFELRHPDRE